VYLYYGKLPSKSYREVKSIIQSQGVKVYTRVKTVFTSVCQSCRNYKMSQT